MTNVPFINSITNELSKRKLKSAVVANAILDIAVGNDRLDDLLTMNSSASEIDGSVNRTNGSSNNTLLNLIKESDNICYCGDSISAGTGVVKKENVVAYNLKEYVRKIKNLGNIGFQTSSNKFNHYHTVKLNSSANWSENYLNSYSINGYSFDSIVLNESISFYTGMINQTKAKVHFVKTDVVSQVAIYVNDVLSQTLNIPAHSNSNDRTIESELLSLSVSLHNIKCVLISGKISVSGVSYYKDSTKPSCDLFVTGGRRIRYIKDEVLTKYLAYDLMFFQLSYNDVIGGSTETQKQEVYTILENIANHYKTNNKTFVYINTVWGGLDSDNWVLQKINLLFNGYEKYFYFDYKSTIKNYNGVLADSDYRINILKEWVDGAHPNDLGHNRFLNYLYTNIFNKFDLGITINDLIHENYSTYNIKNSIGLNLYASNVLGVNNKVHDNANFVNLLGVANETLANDTFALGNYNILSALNSFATGFKNILQKSYSFGIGTYINSVNSGLIFGFSTSASVTKQINKQLRSITTTSSVETFLRDNSNTALISSNNNTRNILKGFVYCFDDANNLFSKFEIDCIVKNLSGTSSVIEGIGTSNGIKSLINKNNVSVSIVSGSSGSYTLRVYGNANSLKWVSDFEIVEITI